MTTLLENFAILSPLLVGAAMCVIAKIPGKRKASIFGNASKGASDGRSTR